jgi:hypothetical protein
MRNWLAIVALLSLAGVPAKAGAQQAIAPADALQLLEAAGMSVNGGKVLNPCQHMTAPKVKFIDLNGDGQPEAVTQDQDAACYGQDPGFQSKILVRDGSGHWQMIVVMLGVFQPLTTRSKGWMDFTNASGSCHPVYSFNGRMYVITGCGIVPQPWESPHGADPAIPVSTTPGPDDNLRLFPATYGSFAPRGDCTHLPLVTISAEAIRIATASGNGSFTHPGLSTNYNGPQDDSITYLLQGGGEGLVVSIDPDGKTLATEGGDDLSAPEKTLDEVASSAPLLRCKP